jgi:excisionase family DNA binding protein
VVPRSVDEPAAPDPLPGPLLFTAEQAAVLLAVTPGWLRRAAGEGRVSSVLIGKHLRFSRQDLDELIERGHRPRSAT